MIPHDHNVWAMLFEQTPVVWRWIFGVLTLGLFWLASSLYTNHKERVNRLETLIVANNKETNTNIKDLHSKIDTFTLSMLNKK